MHDCLICGVPCQLNWQRSYQEERARKQGNPFAQAKGWTDMTFLTQQQHVLKRRWSPASLLQLNRFRAATQAES